MVNKKVLVWLIWNTKGDSSPTGHLTADICKGFATSRPDELNFNGMVGTSDISKRCTYNNFPSPCYLLLFPLYSSYYLSTIFNHLLTTFNNFLWLSLHSDSLRNFWMPSRPNDILLLHPSKHKPSRSSCQGEMFSVVLRLVQVRPLPLHYRHSNSSTLNRREKVIPLYAHWSLHRPENSLSRSERVLPIMEREVISPMVSSMVVSPSIRKSRCSADESMSWSLLQEDCSIWSIKNLSIWQKSSSSSSMKLIVCSTCDLSMMWRKLSLVFR